MPDEIDPTNAPPETTHEEGSPPSTREVLEAAWDHLEKYERESQEPTEEKPSAPSEAPPPEKPVRDASGRFTKPPEEKGPPASTPQAGSRAPTEGVQPPSSSAAPVLTPPRSWRPTLYEAWGKMDPAAQREVIKREREHEQVMQTSAQARQFADEWTRMLQPYMPFIQSTGRPPAQLIGNLFQTAAALASQPTKGRAAIIANIIRSYGVPVEELAQALDNPQAMQPPPMQQQQQPMFDPRVDQLMQRLSVREQEEMRREALISDNELDAFLQANPQAEPWLDYMADYMETAGKRGVDVDYGQAYTVILNAYAPDVAQAMRPAAVQEQEASAPPTPASEAASSVRPEHGQRPTAAPKTNREALEAAWDKLTGGSRV